MSPAPTALFLMPNGRHAGVAITRVPISYLKWMVNTGHTAAPAAVEELARRGTHTPTMDISNHAIDRASLRLATHWRKGRRQDEGLHSWLSRAAESAWHERLRRSNPGAEIVVDGIKYVFSLDGVWPVLLTVMTVPRGKGGAKPHPDGRGV